MSKRKTTSVHIPDDLADAKRLKNNLQERIRQKRTKDAFLDLKALIMPEFDDGGRNIESKIDILLNAITCIRRLRTTVSQKEEIIAKQQKLIQSLSSLENNQLTNTKDLKSDHPQTNEISVPDWHLLEKAEQRLSERQEKVKMHVPDLGVKRSESTINKAHLRTLPNASISFETNRPIPEYVNTALPLTKPVCVSVAECLPNSMNTPMATDSQAPDMTVAAAPSPVNALFYVDMLSTETLMSTYNTMSQVSLPNPASELNAKDYQTPLHTYNLQSVPSAFQRHETSTPVSITCPEDDNCDIRYSSNLHASQAGNIPESMPNFLEMSSQAIGSSYHPVMVSPLIDNFIPTHNVPSHSDYSKQLQSMLFKDKSHNSIHLYGEGTPLLTCIPFPSLPSSDMLSPSDQCAPTVSNDGLIQKDTLAHCPLLSPNSFQHQLYHAISINEDPSHFESSQGSETTKTSFIPNFLGIEHHWATSLVE